MAQPMMYDVILYEKEDPENKLIYPLDGWESVCFFRLAYGLEEVENDWLYELGGTPVLDSLVYKFDEENVSLEVVQQIMSSLFDNCEYNVQWEVTRLADPEEHFGRTCQMFLTGFGDMPRGLFMNKMFCVRNIIRDNQSAEAFQGFLDGGVPLNIAAYLGGALEITRGFDRISRGRLKEYAGYVEYQTPHFAQMIRHMANNVYCEQKSPPWKEGWGYNHLRAEDNVKDENGMWPPRQAQISDSIMFYDSGDGLPPNWDWDDMWAMSVEQLTELAQFICESTDVSFKPKES